MVAFHDLDQSAVSMFDQPGHGDAAAVAKFTAPTVAWNKPNFKTPLPESI